QRKHPGVQADGAERADQAPAVRLAVAPPQPVERVVVAERRLTLQRRPAARAGGRPPAPAPAPPAAPPGRAPPPPPPGGGGRAGGGGGGGGAGGRWCAGGVGSAPATNVVPQPKQRTRRPRAPSAICTRQPQFGHATSSGILRPRPPAGQTASSLPPPGPTA